MPKILDNIEIKILNSAKKQLINNKYLSLRKLASDCEIGIGTIYNYFDDKESILYHVMFDDWNKTLKEMDDIIVSINNKKEACYKIYDCLVKFVIKYEGIWNSYSKDLSFHNKRSKYHLFVRNDLINKFKDVIKKFGLIIDDNLVPVFGEIILLCAIEKDLNKDHYYAFINKII